MVIEQNKTKEQWDEHLNLMLKDEISTLKDEILKEPVDLKLQDLEKRVKRDSWDKRVWARWPSQKVWDVVSNPHPYETHMRKTRVYAYTRRLPSFVLSRKKTDLSFLNKKFTSSRAQYLKRKNRERWTHSIVASQNQEDAPTSFEKNFALVLENSASNVVDLDASSQLQVRQAMELDIWEELDQEVYERYLTFVAIDVSAQEWKKQWKTNLVLVNEIIQDFADTSPEHDHSTIVNFFSDLIWRMTHVWWISLEQDLSLSESILIEPGSYDNYLKQNENLTKKDIWLPPDDQLFTEMENGSMIYDASDLSDFSSVEDLRVAYSSQVWDESQVAKDTVLALKRKRVTQERMDVELENKNMFLSPIRDMHEVVNWTNKQDDNDHRDSFSLRVWYQDEYAYVASRQVIPVWKTEPESRSCWILADDTGGIVDNFEEKLLPRNKALYTESRFTDNNKEEVIPLALEQQFFLRTMLNYLYPNVDISTIGSFSPESPEYLCILSVSRMVSRLNREQIVAVTQRFSRKNMSEHISYSTFPIDTNSSPSSVSSRAHHIHWLISYLMWISPQEEKMVSKSKLESVTFDTISTNYRKLVDVISPIWDSVWDDKDTYLPPDLHPIWANLVYDNQYWINIFEANEITLET